MKGLKKILATAGIATVITATAASAAVFAGCSTAAEPPEIYSNQGVYIEAAYQGDCWNGVNTTLVLNADCTYTLLEVTSIIQQSGVVVTYWSYNIQGTYEVTAETNTEDEQSKTVTLNAATSVTYNMNGNVTTEEDNEDLLTYENVFMKLKGPAVNAAGMTVTCNGLTGQFTID